MSSFLKYRKTSTCSTPSEYPIHAVLSPSGSFASSTCQSIGSHCNSPLSFGSESSFSLGRRSHIVQKMYTPTIEFVQRVQPKVFRSNEDNLTSYFIESDAKLLFAYSKALLARSDYNNYHVRILLKYFKSRGYLTELLTLLAENEIRNENSHNEIFRGNSPFTRVFGEYLKMFCGNYLNTIISPIEEVIEAAKLKISQLNQNDEFFNSAYMIGLNKDVLQTFTQLLTENEMPSHLMYILRRIYNAVYLKRGEKEASTCMETLLFLRFFLPPLASTPSVLKNIQTLLKRADGKLVKVKSNTAEESGFITAVDITYHKVLNGPLQYATASKGVKRVEQDESYHEMVDIIRSELSSISNCFGDGFEKVFQLVKGNREIVDGNVLCATQSMTDWMGNRETALEQENSELKNGIQYLKARNEVLLRLFQQFQVSEDSSSSI
ncbi:hypothetical protein EIN_183930 [Entamoeba invadens IP1]|uniref:hypothetical protein n=1 Tax=Entamoeba invadens IP1 TaxID=370355 RepID=UPI0002C3F65A|nr:hypothetical protein EIN_183930 [Entamoeba invadens IP1]ELP94076.1 hypothetical protein EIN_183930 [Entamoeba invadens IP1]|eukprot:XP_004260847.1 hypothetical protein EIN_183930 [Entamoeba invadens IP1]